MCSPFLGFWGDGAWMGWFSSLPEPLSLSFPEQYKLLSDHIEQMAPE